MMMQAFLQNIKTHPAVRAVIPPRMGMGLPTVSIAHDNICVNIPFFAEDAAPNDQTLIYPFSYVVSALWETGEIVALYSTTYARRFGSIDVRRPVGTFRHDAVKMLDKAAYKQKKSELMDAYDRLVGTLTTPDPYPPAEEQRFVALLNQLVEPSLKQFYRVMDPDFCYRFFADND